MRQQNTKAQLSFNVNFNLYVPFKFLQSIFKIMMVSPHSDKMQMFYVGFQRKVFCCFPKLKHSLSQLGRQCELLETDFHIKTAITLEEFDEIEEKSWKMVTLTS